MAIVATVLTTAVPASAGLDIEDYLPPPQQPSSADEARRQHARVLAERAQAHHIAAEKARLRAAESARQAAVLMERPAGEQLLEARCLNCHPMELVLLTPRTRLAWEALIWRMQWINGAELESGERPIIAAYLTTVRPAPRRRAVFELIALGLLLTIPAVFVLRHLRRTTPRTSPENPT